MATREAAAAMHLSYETVRDYLKLIYQKLRVRTRTGAVLRLLESGHDNQSPARRS